MEYFQVILGPFLSQSGITQLLRAFRWAVLFSLFAWRLVGLLSLRLFVCWFDREGFLRTFRELVLGPLGLHFGSSEGPLGTILGSLGTSWDQFWGSGGSLGLHFWGSGAPLAPLGLFGGPLGRPRCPKPNFPTFFPPILGSFWLHFRSKNRSKI